MTARRRPPRIPIRGQILCAAGLAVVFVGVTGAVLTEERIIQVALRVDQVRRDNLAGAVIAGDRLGVICFDTVSSVTVASTAVPKLLDELRARLSAGDVPAVTSTRTVDLPVAPPSELADVPCDVALFDDADGDGRWQRGESYVTAWNGSVDSVRLVHHRANGGWLLIRGGVPPSEQVLPSDLVVFIDPVIGPVP